MLEVNNIEPTQIFVEKGGQRTELTVLQTEKNGQTVSEWGKPFSLTFNRGPYTTISVSRTSSPYAHATLGAITPSNKIYYGDVLSVIFLTDGSDYTLTTRRIEMGGQIVTSPVTVTGDITITSKATWWEKKNTDVKTITSQVNLISATSGTSAETSIDCTDLGITNAEFNLPTLFVGTYSSNVSGEFDTEFAEGDSKILYSFALPGLDADCTIRKVYSVLDVPSKYVIQCGAVRTSSTYATKIIFRTTITGVYQLAEGD